MNILVFEDSQVDNLFPITTGRAAYAISCGSYRLIDFLFRLGHPVTAIVRSHLRTIQLLDFTDFSPQLDPEQEWTLVVNARLVPTREHFRKLETLLSHPEPCVVRANWSLAAAIIPTRSLSIKDDAALLKSIEAACNQRQDRIAVNDLPLEMFHYPHDVVRWNLLAINDNLEFRIRQGGLRELESGVFAAEDTQIGKHVVWETEKGPIVVDRGAQIGPYCFLRGPAYLGPGSRVIEHSAIKDSVSIGHTTKIGGEVEASVIEPFTNKQHHGFLGHSYLGSWINLGAGTCNSDLKNTYGEVKMELHGQKIATGMQFVGCIMGDYAKTAINTGIFTGKVIGTASMVYGFVTTNVPSFVNYARSFGQVTELPPAVMEATQKRMFSRRNVTQRPCDIQLLHDMYQLTRDERQLAEEPLVF